MVRKPELTRAISGFNVVFWRGNSFSRCTGSFPHRESQKTANIFYMEVSMNILTGILALTAMGVGILAYRLGVRDGQRLSRGEDVKVQPVKAAIKAAIKAVQQVTHSTAEEARNRELKEVVEGMANILQYSGEKQE
jgi:hypothetical protein